MRNDRIFDTNDKDKKDDLGNNFDFMNNNKNDNYNNEYRDNRNFNNYNDGNREFGGNGYRGGRGGYNNYRNDNYQSRDDYYRGRGSFRGRGGSYRGRGGENRGSYRGRGGRGFGSFNERGGYRSNFHNNHDNNNLFNNENSFYEKNKNFQNRQPYNEKAPITSNLFENPEVRTNINTIIPPSNNIITSQIKVTTSTSDAPISKVKLLISEISKDLKENQLEELFPNLIEENLFESKLLMIVQNQNFFKEKNNSHSKMPKMDFFSLTFFDIMNQLITEDYLLDVNYSFENSFSNQIEIFNGNVKYLSREVYEIGVNYRKNRKTLIRNGNMNYNYYPIMCKEKLQCNNQSCNLSHSEEEIKYHPILFKTKKCNDDCHMSICFDIAYQKIHQLQVSNFDVQDNENKVTLFLCPYYHSINDYNNQMNMQNINYFKLKTIFYKRLRDFYLSELSEEVEHFYSCNLKILESLNQNNTIDIDDQIINFLGFDLETFKVYPCSNENLCKWNSSEKEKLCLFYHSKSDSLRRPLKLYQYSEDLCENKLNSRCKLEDFCPKSHSKYEYYYHPLNFRKIRKCINKKIKKFPICELISTCYGYHNNNESTDCISDISLTCVKCKENYSYDQINILISNDLEKSELICENCINLNKENKAKIVKLN